MWTRGGHKLKFNRIYKYYINNEASFLMSINFMNTAFRCLDHFDVKILENYLSRTENNAAAVVKICQLLKKRIFHSNTNLQVAAVFPL